MQKSLKSLEFLSLCGALLFTLQLLFLWPGILDYDYLNYLPLAQNFEVQPWMSYSFSYYLMGWLHMLPHPSAVLLFFGALYILVLYGIFRHLQKNSSVSPRTLVWIYFALLFWPYLMSQNLLLSRDTLSGLLQATLITILYLLYQKKQSFTAYPKTEALLLSLLTVISAELRQDSSLFLILVPLFLFLYFPQKVFLRCYVGGLIPSFLFFFLIVPSISGIPRTSQQHAMAGLLNPVQEIIQRGGLKSLSPEDQQQFHNHLDVSAIIKDPLAMEDIWVQHRQHIHSDPRAAKDFLYLSLKLILKNPGLFFENRLRFLNSYLGWGQKQQILLDELKEPISPVKSHLEKYTWAENGGQRYQRAEIFQFWIDGLAHFTFTRILFLSLLPFAILGLCLLWTYRKEKWFWLLMILSWYRFPLVVLLAPAPCTKYVYGIALSTLFLGLLQLPKLFPKKNH